jgi:hypothetical protein
MDTKKRNKFRHNKKRNTAFLFEVLVKELTVASLQKDEEKKRDIVSLLKKHFSKGTVLHKELDLYRSLTEARELTKEIAEKMISEAKRIYSTISQEQVFTSQTNLIKDISLTIGDGVYSNFVPNYKDLATLAQIFKGKGTLTNRVLMEQKQVEILTSRKEEKKNNLQHISNLTFRSFIKRFNNEYSGKLYEEQAKILNKFIHSFSDGGLELKIFLNEEIARLKNVISNSLSTKEISEDKRMSLNTNKVLGILDSFRERPLDEQSLKKILKIQELAREVL